LAFVSDQKIYNFANLLDAK